MARAGILSVVLALHAVAACPVERVDETTRRDPRMMTAAAAGASALAALGIRTTAASVAAFLARFANGWCDVQDVLMAPVAPAFRALEVHQRWGLFTTAPAVRWRIDVEAQGGDGAPFRLLYRPHDPTHRWQAERIEYRRLRGVWNPIDTGVTPAFRPFVRWLARTAFAEDAHATSVRVRVFALRLPAPGAVAPADVAPVPAHESLVRRAEVDSW